jgi:CHAT domain-containing protein
MSHIAHSPWEILCLALIPICLCGCQKTDPQGAYEHAKQTYREGRIATAETEARQDYEKFHKISAEWAWRFLILRAIALHAESNDAQALALFEGEANPPSTGELAIRRLRVLSLVNAATGHSQAATIELQQAEQLCAVSDVPACADVFSAKGQLAMNHADYQFAENFFEQSLTSARLGGDRFVEANALLNLSWSADEQTHFDDALRWAEAAYEIALSRHFADIAQTALGNMGWAYYKLGDREKARQMFAEAADQAERLGDVDDQISWTTNGGYVYFDERNFEVAAESFRRSLELARKIKNRGDMMAALQALAFVSEQTGKIDDATRYADEALSMARADGNKRDETYPRLVQGRVAARLHDFSSAEAAFHEVASSSDSPVFLKWEAERSLASLYEDENQIARADAEYRTALSTFERARSELQHENSRLPFLNNATRIYDDYIRLLLSQGKIEEALQVADYSRARTLSEGLGVLKRTSSFQPDPLNAQEIARGAGGTILFYWLGEKQSYLWAITPSQVRLFTLPPVAEIDAAVQRYRKALLGPEDPAEVSNNDGLWLHRALVAPAADLVGKNGRVFIIPDGSLNTLNFETLLADSPKPHYWIEDVTIADASSLRLLGRTPPLKTSIGNSFSLVKRASAAKAVSRNRPLPARLKAARFQDRELLLFGNAATANADYPELRKASVEMESIEKHFAANQQRVFARQAATPSAYLESRPEQYSYIHFVAHGTASRMNPLDSAIVLSAASSQEDSFKLYARDIIQQPLRANLVTISTCYGAGARAYSGEGLVGLSWAFLRAGAHNVIGALWEVSDVSTPQLMDDLYEQLQQGQTPDAALRAAKLDLLHSGGSFRRPFYWAPFQLYTGW